VFVNKAEWKIPVKLIAIKGQLDSHTVPDLEAAFRTELESPPDAWAIEFTSLEYISSAGLAALVGLKYKLEERKGGLCFYGMTDKVFRVFKMLGMVDMFAIHANEEAARAKFGE
jgi:anti-anti-sigma factor